jgi:hypothetical protein
MSEEYLWDRSGPPDPEIEQLERTLAPLGLAGQAARPAQRGAVFRFRWLAAAAAVILGAVAIARFAVPPSQPTSWQVARTEGSVRLGGQEAAVAMPVRTGQALRTGTASGLTIQADELGQVDLGPDSELRAATGSQLLLRRGTLHAYIWAPPRQFVVDTPSSRAIDLGCEYTVTVNGEGDGVLKVSYGWVALQFGDQEAFIPAGAECVTRRRLGPGIPYYGDAPQPMRDALAGFERGDAAALAGVLASARPRDALTLWHLLTRVAPADRGLAFDRFAQLVALPPEVTRDGALRKDARTIDQCWDALHLEKTDWWRGWERKR